jgi:hypothetical protein
MKDNGCFQNPAALRFDDGIVCDALPAFFSSLSIGGDIEDGAFFPIRA